MANNISRREFTRLLSAGAIAVSASVRARAQGANERLRLGVIGCGGRGQDDLRHFLANGADIAAVCDPDEHRMREAQALAGGKSEMIKDFRRLLDRKDIDAVVVATPDHWHALPTVLACQAGKDVYVEKPLAYTVAEGRAMVDAARRNGRIVQIGTQQRAGAHYHRAVSMVRDGEIGKVTRARVWNVWNNTVKGGDGRSADIGNPADGEPPAGVDYDMWLGPAPKRPFNPNRFHWNYVYYWDYAGGMMTGWGVHHVDVVHWALGQDTPRSVASSGGRYIIEDSRETPDTLDTLLEYEGFTLQASMYHGNARPIEGRDYGVALYGSKATMLITREGFEVWPEGDSAQAIHSEGSPLDGPFQKEFIDCCKSRIKPFADVEIGHKSTIPVLLANIAYKVNRKLRWDGALEKFIDDPEADRLLSREYRAPWKLA